ncbi:hypothetical protein VNO80_10317 [Phaseolus coccineus]|uniref:Uncharacterized protein n=1 Tax=Phaseolus coccineus TaxID=3886 RepID=A0AAN9N8C5_PHACN
MGVKWRREQVKGGVYMVTSRSGHRFRKRSTTPFMFLWNKIQVGLFQLGEWKVAKLEVAKYEVGNGRCVVGH